MSEIEANLPGLELTESQTTKKTATKKAARKTATKKAARKTATKKTAAKATEASSQPAAEPAAAAPAAREETAPPARRETPPSRARKDDHGDSAPPARAPRRNTAPRRADSEDNIPKAFSASPDDIDDYGDVRERGRRERTSDSSADSAAGDNRPQRSADAASEGDAQQSRGEGNGPRPYPQRDNRDGRDRDNRDGRDFNREGGRDGNRDGARDSGRENGRDGGRDSARDGNREGSREGGREFNRPQHGNNPQGKGYNQPYGKKGHFQKGNYGGNAGQGGNSNPQGNGGQGGGNGGAQGGNGGGQPQGQNQGQGQGGNKFQKPFKKGDKFNPNHPNNPANAQQAGKKVGKPLHPGKIKGGKKGSWQSQFAAASEEDTQPPVFDGLIEWDLFRSPEQLAAKIDEITRVGAATDDAAASTAADASETAAATVALSAGDAAGVSSAQELPAAPADAEDATAAADSDSAADTDGDATAAKDTDSTEDNAEATVAALAAGAAGEPFDYAAAYALKLPELESLARQSGIRWEGAPQRRRLLEKLLEKAAEQKRPIRVKGLVELLEEGFGFVVFGEDNYRLRSDSPFLAAPLVNRYGLQRGHEIEALLHPAREGETTPFVLRVDSVMGKAPEDIQLLTPFKELTPYYPTERILLESEQGALGKWDNISMRIVDLLSPVGLGQRGLIVAPPRTGKTVLMQGIANAIRVNRPEARLIILLVDERPEEVTDFRRSVKGAQVVASTFDEAAESHVHAAEMVIEKARRLVEVGEDVIILLDSITRLARAYNTTMPSSGKILSGGVEASALQKPKRFFGSARNIEGGGSLTILGTALVDTGSKMDEVIFEEFKGTGNMELHLDRDLSNKRVFPSLSFEKSGTRKEELLYHPDEMEKVHALRRAMKGVPSTEAMEMLIQRVKRSKTNAQFLMSMAR